MTINNSISQNKVTFQNCEHGKKSLTKNVADTVLNSNDSRKYAAFINTSAAEITLVLASRTEAIAEEGIILQPGGSYEINMNNLYIGEVSAISSIDSKLSFIEGD